MHRVSKRLHKDRSPALETWDQAIRRLRRGDHYLLVIRRQRPGIHGPEIVGFSVAALLLAAIFSLRWLTHQIAPPNPYVIRAVFRAIIFAIVFFPAALGNAFGWILDKFTRKERDEE